MDFVQFSNNQSNDIAFYKELKKRVNKYFTDNKISPKAGIEMFIKTFFFLCLYIIPFILTLIQTSPWYIDALFTFLMGLGVAGVGMNIMHDACHHAYAHKRWVNELLSGSLYLLGSNVINWKIQHNVLHHTFTNVYGIDEDINEKGPIRLSYGSSHKKYQRFQHIYAYFFYGLMTIFMIGNDFNKLYNYHKTGLLESQGKSMRSELIRMIFRKLFYIAIIIGLPLWLTNYSIWQVFLGFFIMHWTASIILSLVFQMAHVVEGVENHIQPKKIEHHWSVHQLKTTSDFARDSKLLDWCIGGLNFQIEHHLFPNICHTHYKHIAPIVERTAKEYGHSYNLKPSLISALSSHAYQLKALGNKEPHINMHPNAT